MSTEGQEDKRFLVLTLEELKKVDPEQAEEHDVKWSYDYRLYLYDTKQKVVVFVDGIEPEDVSLDRDLKPLVTLLNKVDSERLET